MKITNVKFYRASGAGLDIRDSLPVDMLRYDLAFCRPEDPTLVAFPKFKGGRGGSPTLGRWKSFLIHLEEITREVWGVAGLMAIREEFKSGRGGWITYRHPKPKYKPTDYTRYTEVSLLDLVTANNRKFEELLAGEVD